MPAALAYEVLLAGGIGGSAFGRAPGPFRCEDSAVTAIAPSDSVPSTALVPASPIPNATAPSGDAQLGLEAAALSLFANGHVGAAEPLFTQLASAPGAAPEWAARARLARETLRADAAVRAAVSDGFVPVPSAERAEDGTPRFVMQLDPAWVGSKAGVQRFRAELQGAGVEGELRTFLGEVLDDGAAYVDWDPVDGIVAMSALTVPGFGGAVAARLGGTAAAALRRSAEQAGAAARLSLVDPADEHATLDETVGMLGGAMVHVHAGSAEAVPTLVASGMPSIQSGRIASFAWRVSAEATSLSAAERTTATVLSVLGFQHFAVLHDGAEVVLQPIDDQLAGQALVVSLSPAYLRKSTDDA